MSRIALSPGLLSRPALPIAAAFLAGLALERARLMPVLSSELLALVILGTCALAAILVAGLRPSCFTSGRSERALAVAAACAIALPLGALRERGPDGTPTIRAWRERGWIDALDARAIRATGRVRGVLRDDGGEPAGILFDLELESFSLGRGSLPIRGRLILGADDDAAPVLRAADRVSLWCRLRDPLDPCAAWSADRDVLRGRVTSTRLIEPSGRAGSLRRLRELVRARLDAASPAGPGRGLARALVLGERDALDAGLVEGMALAGTVHVLSVSGLHVALMGGLVAWLATLVGARPHVAGVAGAATGWLFVLLAGFSIPAIRSAGLLSVVALAGLLSRGVDGWNALAVSALVSGLLAPREAFSLSFVLSFAACAGLVALVPPIRAALPVKGPVALHAARDAVATGLAAWLALVPVAAGAFHRLQPLSALLNLAAIPLAAAATALSLAAAMLSLVSARATGATLWLVDLLARALDAADAPGELLDPRVATPPPGLVAAWAAAALVLGLTRSGRLRLLALGILALALAAIAGREPARESNLLARVRVLDVGQGQALLVEIARPGAQPWRALVDAGGWPGSRFDVGERLVGPALWDRGITRLDAVILTHADLDHRGGAPSVVRLFRPERLVLAPVAAGSRAAFEPALAAARAVGSEVELAAAGSAWRPTGGRARLRALWPPRDPARRTGLSSNDAGLVLLLESEDGRPLAFLPADIERGAEQALVAAGAAATPLLVLAHHGSRTSSSPALLGALRPRLALASAGRANRFGHPHPTVLDRLREQGIPVHVTAAEGGLSAAFTGGLVRVDSCGCERTSVARAVSSAREPP